MSSSDPPQSVKIHGLPYSIKKESRVTVQRRVSSQVNNLPILSESSLPCDDSISESGASEEPENVKDLKVQQQQNQKPKVFRSQES